MGDRYYPGYKDAMAFLDESHETAIAEEKAKEEARKRELEQARRLAEEERRSKSLWQKLVWTFGVAVIAIGVGLYYIAESRETIRDNLSRVSLKEANRLANNNQQDEAIALLAKTIEDNPGYEAAGIRLMSMLEHTALPTGVEKIHSTDDEFRGGNHEYSIALYAEHDMFVERGEREDGRIRYRLFNLASGELIKSWESENQIGSGRVTKTGNISTFRRGMRLKIPGFIFMIFIRALPGFKVLRDAWYSRLSDNGKIVEVFFTDGSYTVYSVEQEKPIFEYNEAIIGGRNSIAMSPDGKNVAMAVEELNKVDIFVVDLQKNQRELLKTYPVTEANIGLRFTGDSQSLFVSVSGVGALNDSRSFDLVDIQSGSSVDIRPDSDGRWGRARLFLNNGIMVVMGWEGDLAMAAYPFENFIRMQGHNGGVSSSSVSNDGMMLASGSEDRTVRLWSVATGEQLAAPLRFENSVLDVGFAPNDRALHVAVLGGDLYKVNLPFRKAEQASYELVMRWGSSVSYDPDLDRIATMGPKRLTVADLKAQKTYPIKVENGGLSGRGNSRYFPLWGDWGKEEILFFSTTQETNVVLKRIKYRDKSIAETVEIPPGTISVRLDSLGGRLVLLSTNNFVSVMGLESGKMIGKPFSMDNRYYAARPTGDEDLMYGYSRQRGISFDINSGDKVGSSINFQKAGVDFLPATRKYLLTSGSSSVVYVGKDRMESVTELELGQVCQSHGVNPEETLIAVATEDGSVTVWDIEKGQKVDDTLKHDYEVEGVVFHPHNDRYVFTFMDGGNLYGWDRKEGNIFMGPVKLFSGRGLYINSEGTVLTAPGFNGRVYRVPVQIPQKGFDYSIWLPGLANSMVGFRVNDSGGFESLSREESLKLKEEARAIAAGGPMANWMTWLTDESSTAKAGPVGDTTRDQIVADLAKSGTLTDLRKALHLSPSNPELLSAYAHQMLLTGGVEEKTKRTATYRIANARELGGDNAVVFYRSAQIEKMLNNQADALKYIDRAIELDSANAEYADFKKSLLQNN